MEFILPSVLSRIIELSEESTTMTEFTGISPAEVHVSTSSSAFFLSPDVSWEGRPFSRSVTVSTFMSLRNSIISTITMNMESREKNTAPLSRK